MKKKEYKFFWRHNNEPYSHEIEWNKEYAWQAMAQRKGHSMIDIMNTDLIKKLKQDFYVVEVSNDMA